MSGEGKTHENSYLLLESDENSKHQKTNLKQLPITEIQNSKQIKERETSDK